MYGTVSTLIIPFIALCILSVLVDRFTMFLERIMKAIPFLPDRFEATLAYLFVFAAGYVVCWRGNFDFFANLNFTFQHVWEGWLLTSLLLSGGSKFVRTSFGMMSSIPQVVSNVYSSVSGIFNDTGTEETSTTIQSEESSM